MCSTRFTWSCRILPFSLPTTNNFLKFGNSVNLSGYDIFNALKNLITEVKENENM